MSNETALQVGSETMPPWVESASLPAFAQIDGRNVVLVDAGEYRALLALTEAVLQLAGSSTPSILAANLKPGQEPQRKVGRSVRLSRLDKDTEVGAFIVERIGTEDVKRIRQAAIERFGPHRVPSRSGVSRFVTAHRCRASDG